MIFLSSFSEHIVLGFVILNASFSLFIIIIYHYDMFLKFLFLFKWVGSTDSGISFLFAEKFSHFGVLVPLISEIMFEISKIVF